MSPYETAASESLSPAEVAGLARRLTGPVVLPGDAGFDAECATFNLATPVRPAVAIGATTVADVREAVGFAAERALPIAVLTTGHQVVNRARGAVLITLSRMDAVEVDPVAGIARVQGGARWSQVTERAGESGLAGVSAASPTVGVAGYHLGGGHSPILGRTHGYAADHVRALRLVTADSALREVTADAEPELFWGVRGGKGNFGVVTSMEFALFAVKSFYGGGLFFAGEHASTVLHTWREWVTALPRQMSSSIAFRHRSRPAEFAVHVRFSALGSPAEAEAALAPLRALAPAVRDTVAETAYRDGHRLHLDPSAPVGWLERSAALRSFPAEAADALLAVAGPDSGTEPGFVELRALGGALADEPAVPNAVAGRGAPWALVASGGQEAGTRLDSLVEALAPWSQDERNANLLAAGDATTPAEVRAAYGSARYERLAQLKRRHDPQNLFRVNHNIAPAASPPVPWTARPWTARWPRIE
ncbi:FAD-binding oxidoreductase [Amycolatopsis sp. DSM 110486]|uniref:FAD-binding oxidoreductase n=1 Tax=Amycolatopsis sp. DSM 110486 TaxID=2865832 RepID=UPI001C69C1D7|nr:FAD-binding oxidoreductase [Amycolatopsis sp. DSM 110486]QYN22652.1 FAD-binding oxidoreductase [Amycolatopsis sp. DSM 110486]